eukprot:5565115-Prymnesium_polylepis.1
MQKWIGKGDLVLERLNEPQPPASLFDKMLACESDQGGGDGALGKKLQQVPTLTHTLPEIAR